MKGDQILNQAEINDLIERLKVGGAGAIDIEKEEEVKEQYQEYDFNRPDKFTTENIQSLESIAKAFARVFSQEISAKCRYPITVRLSKPANERDKRSVIEQVPYATEYIRVVGKDRWVFCIVDLGLPELGQIILQMDLSFTIPIHENLLGDGEKMDWAEEMETLSEMDSLVMQDWIESAAFPALRNSFQNIEQFNLVLKKIETDPQYVKITRDSDVVALIPFDVELGAEDDRNGRTGAIQICIPYMAIEAIAEKLTTENAIEYQLGGGPRGQEKMVEHHLEMVKQMVDIELGKGSITVRELLKLKKEDVLHLDQNFKEELLGYVGGMPKFSCKPGRNGERYAVRVTGFAERLKGE